MSNETSDSSYLFIKWFIVAAAIIAVACIAAQMGFISLVIASDISHLSIFIAGLFVVASTLTGKLCYDISNESIDPVTVKKRLKILNFMADSFFTLGLLGTIIGFCYMMAGSHAVLNNTDVNVIIQQLKVGSSTKLFATLSGIVSSLLLQVQILLIEVDKIKTVTIHDDK